jgi:hypothetical protein
MSTIPRAPHRPELDLSTPPIIKDIGKRALIVGVIAAVVVIFLAFANPTAFFRGYLVSYMDGAP